MEGCPERLSVVIAVVLARAEKSDCDRGLIEMIFRMVRIRAVVWMMKVTTIFRGVCSDLKGRIQRQIKHTIQNALCKVYLGPHSFSLWLIHLVHGADCCEYYNVHERATCV